MKHVVMKECRVCEGEGKRERLVGLQRAVTEIDEAIIRPSWVKRRVGRENNGGRGREVGGVVMTLAEREEARGEAWTRQVRAVRRAVTWAMRGERVEEEDWVAMRQLMGGVVHMPAAAKGWDARVARLKESAESHASYATRRLSAFLGQLSSFS